MALIELNFKPGIDKQDTEAGAENRWVDSDNVRFRYGLPEKVGGWASLTTDTIVGVVRKQHAFVDNDGNRYVALGTDKFLLLYFEGQLYDITPVKTTLTSATIATTNGSPTCTITKAAHGVKVGDIVQLDSVTLPGGTGFNNSDFEDKNFQVISVPTTGTFTINQSSNASGTVSTGGSLSIIPYEPVGPREQTYGYGWGMDPYGNGNWGEAAAASDVTLEPGLWSLSNFGEVLIATVLNGKTFTWNSGIGARLTTRASTTTSNFETTSNPTKTRVTLVSPTTRHLIHLGTETTIGTPSTQDDMFIRFSDQEAINTYAPSATNTAGTQRLQDGTKIMGALKAKEVILIWTDNALYTMKFIGSPFTFGLSPKGFFMFDGTVKSLSCTVEDSVFDNFDTTKGQQVNAGLNNLFTEITWYYPSSTSDFNNKYVVFNFGESAGVPGGVWYTGTEARTSWMDATIYPNPYATKYNSTGTGTFPAVVGQTGLGQTTYFEHEVGTDQVNPNGTTTAVSSFIQSFDFDLEQRSRNQRGQATGPKVAGEVFIALRRFVPDFKTLQGNAKVTIGLKRYPQQSSTSSTYSPFTITSTTTKKDTRARGRFCSFKIENDAASESWRFGTFRVDIQPDGRR